MSSNYDPEISRLLKEEKDVLLELLLWQTVRFRERFERGQPNTCSNTPTDTIKPLESFQNGECNKYEEDVEEFDVDIEDDPPEPEEFLPIVPSTQTLSRHYDDALAQARQQIPFCSCHLCPQHKEQSIQESRVPSTVNHDHSHWYDEAQLRKIPQDRKRRVLPSEDPHVGVHNHSLGFWHEFIYGSSISEDCMDRLEKWYDDMGFSILPWYMWGFVGIIVAVSIVKLINFFNRC